MKYAAFCLLSLLVIACACSLSIYTQKRSAGATQEIISSTEASADSASIDLNVKE